MATEGRDRLQVCAKTASLRLVFVGGLILLAASVAACTTGSVLSLEPAVDVGSSTAAVPRMASPAPPRVEMAAIAPPTAGLQTLVPSDPYLVGYPRIDPPMASPQMDGQTDYLPPEEVDCRRELKRLKVEFSDLAPIREGQCGIDHPVKVAAIGSVGMKPAATLSCAMALTFAQWTKNELVPSARRRYFTGVRTIHQGSSYSCRKIADSRGVLSEHGKGNALDIMRIELNNGKDIDVKKPGLFAFRQRGFLNNVRADGCQYFNTVLGPGYNYDHRNHFHFDIKQRRSNHVACR
ncbi:extensin family protein [Mesorhizobium sp. KR9-304]|uniref:extensin-like domain-containing protein n=1 Tax=Mesorhizobium sp. KR9-304 TaxID=3156614 RepID=UPI0032B5237D